MLWGMTLPIKLNTSTQWVLNESHVLVALRLAVSIESHVNKAGMMHRALKSTELKMKVESHYHQGVTAVTPCYHNVTPHFLPWGCILHCKMRQLQIQARLA